MAFGATALGQQKAPPSSASRIVPGNSIRMDDDFEYQFVDYGLGKLEIRDVEGHVMTPSPDLFWMKLRVTNRSAHLLGNPRYVGSLDVADNWGNRYSANSFFLGILPFPVGKNDRHKPGESSFALRTLNANELTHDIREFRIYLDRWRAAGQTVHFFLIPDPLQRQRDAVREQSDPDPRELQVHTGTETLPRGGRQR